MKPMPRGWLDGVPPDRTPPPRPPRGRRDTAVLQLMRSGPWVLDAQGFFGRCGKDAGRLVVDTAGNAEDDASQWRV